MEGRAKIPPGLPRANPTTSYWQEPPDEIANLRSTPDLPSSAQYLIIGSGISGAFIAHEIYERNPNANVVMLEARSTCSGATGRNGGHTKAASYRSFMNNVDKFGMDEARRIARLEFSNITSTHAFAKDHNIDCDSKPCETVDIMYDLEVWRGWETALKFVKENLTGGEEYEVLDKEETCRRYHTPTALAAVKYNAGSVSGYKLVVGALKLSLAKGMNLQTYTPVDSIQKVENSATWNVHTSRGIVRTENVILATNGYTAHLWPAFQGVIVPLRGQITAQRPGSGLPAEGLSSTYSFIYSNGYEYMIPRPLGSKFSGDIIIGGGWACLGNDVVNEYGETDDTLIDQRLSDYLTSCTAEYFGENWGTDSLEGRVRTEWSGIMGNSADGVPYVGAVPDTEGLWISASFDGHGMALCLNCAKGLVGLMFGEDESLDSWFPNSFKITTERLHKAFEGRRNMEPPSKEPKIETQAQL